MPKKQPTTFEPVIGPVFLWYRKFLRNSYIIKNAPLWMRTRAIGICCINATALGARMSQATFFFIE
ncbi:MAG: hypothetical protein E7309_10460 [Butyrivibrio sp.]|nr:hypothetical protein [Butyrivibrio sp.]